MSTNMSNTNNVLTNPSDPLDPWSIASGAGYSIDNFYVRSTDGKGHSENIQAKLSPAVLGQLQALISGGICPYRTVQDFIRDAVIHRAKYLHEASQSGRIKEITEDWVEVFATDAFKTLMRQRAEASAAIRECVELAIITFNDHIARNRRGEAVRHIDEFESYAITMAARPEYREMERLLEDWRSQVQRLFRTQTP